MSVNFDSLSGIQNQTGAESEQEVNATIDLLKTLPPLPSRTEADAADLGDVMVLREVSSERVFVLETPASGDGDVVGPDSSTDGALAQFDGTDGKLLKSGPTITTEITDESTDDEVPTALAVYTPLATITETLVDHDAEIALLQLTNDLGTVLAYTATPPGSPTTGDRYLIKATATGAWAGHEDEIATYNGSGWGYGVPAEGNHLYVANEDVRYQYDGAAWAEWESGAPYCEWSTDDDGNVVPWPSGDGTPIEMNRVAVACVGAFGESLITGDTQAAITIPTLCDGWTVMSVEAGLGVAAGTGSTTVNIRNVSSELLTTAITIEATEDTSLDATTQPVIDATYAEVAAGDKLYIDIDAVGTGAQLLTVLVTLTP